MLPKDTLSEILLYLVEHEEFKSIDKLGSLSQKEVREGLKELAFSLRQEIDREQSGTVDIKHMQELSPKVKHALSTLTNRELQTLIKSFGIEK